MDIPKSALKQIIIMKKEESFFVGRELKKVIMKNMENVKDFNGNYSLVVKGVEKAGFDVRTAFETVHGKAQNVLHVNIGSYGDSSKSSVDACFYVEEMLENGLNPDDVVERIIHHIKTNSGKDVVEGIGNIIENPEEILRRAKIVLRPSSERYDNVVKKEGIFENTYLIATVAADTEEDGAVSTCFVPKYLLKKHGLTEASLWDAAYKNTREELRLATMAEVLPKEMINGCFEDDILNMPPYVVRTKSGANGAACIMLPDIKELIRERFGGGRYFVIPSSIHECLLFPDDGMVTEGCLNNMVSEVNEKEVDASEFLASSVAILDI